MRTRNALVALVFAVGGLMLAAPAHATEPSGSATPSAPASAHTEKKTPPPRACALYVYQGTQTTLCVDFPHHKDVDCKDLKGKVVKLIGRFDPWGLDRNHNGWGCEAPTSPSPSVSVSTSPTPSVSPSPTPSRTTPTPRTTTTPPVVGANLPVTGQGVTVVAGVGVAVLVVGAVLFVVARRRKQRFTAE